jgi:hypothetical protein
MLFSRSIQPCMVIALVLCAGCLNSPTDKSSRATSLMTEKSVYQFTQSGDGYHAQVVLSFANVSSEPLFLARCDAGSQHPFYQVYRVQAEQPDPNIGQAWNCPGGSVAPLEVAPNSARIDTVYLEVSEPRAQNAALPADFVIRYAVLRGYHNVSNTAGEPVEGEGVSNRFTLDLER